MNPRANIKIYGLWDGIAGGAYGKNLARTMGAQFNELVDFIKESDIAMDVDINFIDLLVDHPGEAYSFVRGLYNSGYRFPYVVINDKLTYYGAIPVWDIYNETKRYIEYGYIYE